MTVRVIIISSPSSGAKRSINRQTRTSRSSLTAQTGPAGPTAPQLADYIHGARPGAKLLTRPVWSCNVIAKKQVAITISDISARESGPRTTRTLSNDRRLQLRAWRRLRQLQLWQMPHMPDQRLASLAKPFSPGIHSRFHVRATANMFLGRADNSAPSLPVK
jgi:hypothetical protein